jgi:hypothetical protein
VVDQQLRADVAAVVGTVLGLEVRTRWESLDVAPDWEVEVSYPEAVAVSHGTRKMGAIEGWVQTHSGLLQRADWHVEVRRGIDGRWEESGRIHNSASGWISRWAS